MRSKEGLYTGKSEESFRSTEEVRRNFALEGKLPPVFETPIKVPLNVNFYLNSAKKRAEQQKELSPITEGVVKVRFPETSIINVIGDIHFGHPNTNIDRVIQELEVIRNTPNSYVLLVGDLVDGIFWGGDSGGEQSANLTEQRGFLTSLFSSLKGRVIAGIGGEHDQKWSSKTGADPYFDFTERTGAPYIRGIAEIEIGVGEETYKIVASHRSRGFSMYNKNHPTYREARFELQDADVYVSAHTHRKQISKETLRKFGRADEVTHISIGPYKTGDVYGERMGFVSQKESEMYGCAFRVNKERKYVDVEYSIIEAGRKWE